MILMRRVPLQIVEGRLILTAVIACSSLRIKHQLMEFVVDTGSLDSYFSQKDVIRLQIPVTGKTSEGIVEFGGSRYAQVSLPRIKMVLLSDDKDKNDSLILEAHIKALKTTKTSEKKREIATTLPSILGMDFLRKHKLSLHVILTEEMAFLQIEE